MLVDVVVRANGHYSRAFPTTTTIGGVLAASIAAASSFAFVGAIALAWLVAGLVRRRTEAMLGAALAASALLAVAVQQKFVEVHCVTLVGPVTYS